MMSSMKPPAAPDLTVDSVRLSYGETTMEFDTVIKGGAVTAVTGPSGSGKSTLLNLIAGFEHPAGGRILAGGEDITHQPPDKRPVSMIFQDNNVFDHLSVEKNILLGISPDLHPSSEQREAAREAISRTGLAGKENRLPTQLSGGERQRVALARALIRRKPFLLMDEPFASLGPALRHQMVELVRQLQMETGITIMFVTHHPEDIHRLADRYLFISDGKIARSGPATEIAAGKDDDLLSSYLGSAEPDDR